MQPDFQAALQTVMEFELTLRRVARLELMRRSGRRWLVDAPAIYEAIEPRITLDTRAGVYDSASSELSYLTLRELGEFIFKQSWHSMFRGVFHGKLSYLSEIQQKITPLRNKVAHFRPIKKVDLFNARGIAEMRDELRSHYTRSNLTTFHIQSDPCYIDSWIDRDITSEAISALTDAQHQQIWTVVAEGEHLRQLGYSLGLGIFNGHLFLEFYSDTGFPVEALDNHLQKNKEAITFLSLHANKLRVFFSLANDQKETSKQARGIQRLLSANRQSQTSDGLNTGGVTEYFIGPNMAPTFSFAL